MDHINDLENEINQSSTDITKNSQPLLPEVPKKKSFHLEPLIFLFAFAASLVDIIMVNMIQAQYCSAVLNRPQADCRLDTTTASIPRDEIVTFTATFQMFRTLMEGALPCFLSFFVGPWSDTYGRKPLLISSALGNLIRCAIYTWASTIPQLNPMYFIMFSIPYGVFGGSIFTYLSSSCYICDITTTEKRTTRLGILSCIIVLGIIAGLQLGPWLSNFGYPVVFATASVLAFISFIYACFILPESVTRRETDTNAENKNPFSYIHIRNLIDTCYVRQTPANRLIIILTILLCLTTLISQCGDDGILYVYLQKVRNITLIEYASLTTFIIIEGSVLVTFMIVTFTHILKVDDLYLLSFSVFIGLLGALSSTFGYKLWHFYISRTLNNFINMNDLLIRSFLSKSIPQEQLGKVFSLLTSVEFLAPVIAPPIYVQVYNWTITIFPGTVFLLSALIMLIDLFLAIILMDLSRTSQPS